MDTFTAEAVRLSLKKMFRPGGHFSICDVKSCLDAAGIEAPEEELRALHPLHCVHWSERSVDA